MRGTAVVAGLLRPGMHRTTDRFPDARTCGFDLMLGARLGKQTFNVIVSSLRGISLRSARLPGQKGKLTSPCHLPFGGLLDLLGLRDGVFPGVALLSRRR